MVATFHKYDRMIELYSRGFSYSLIADQLMCCKHTIIRAIRKWKAGKHLVPKAVQKQERKSKLTSQQTFNVLKYFIQNPFHSNKECINELKLPVCNQTITNILSRNKFATFVACKKNFISMQNQIKRLRFALKYRYWTTEWLRVCFGDEKTIQTYANGTVRVKRKRNDRFNVQYMSINEKQNTKNKVSGGSIWTKFSKIVHSGTRIFFSIHSKYICILWIRWIFKNF